MRLSSLTGTFSTGPKSNLYRCKTSQLGGELQAVEATVAAGKLVHKVGVQAPERAVAPIVGMGVILPTFLNVMHGQDNWQGQHVSEVYGDHTSWDAPFLVDLLGKFFHITRSFSLVDLQEELARTDKVNQYLVVVYSICMVMLPGTATSYMLNASDQMVFNLVLSESAWIA